MYLDFPFHRLEARQYSSLVLSIVSQEQNEQEEKQFYQSHTTTLETSSINIRATICD